MMRLVAAVHSVLGNMNPLKSNCVMYLHHYITNNGKSARTLLENFSVPNFYYSSEMVN